MGFACRLLQQHVKQKQHPSPILSPIQQHETTAITNHNTINEATTINTIATILQVLLSIHVFQFLKESAVDLTSDVSDRRNTSEGQNIDGMEGVEMYILTSINEYR
jgi:hypothetical protein